MIRLPKCIPAFLLFLLFSLQTLSAQEQAGEKRIKITEVPLTITDYISTYYPTARTKCYRSISANGHITYELELIKNKKRTYLTFNEEGQLTAEGAFIPYDTVPNQLRHIIRTDLRERYNRHSIKSCKSVVRGQTQHYEVLVKANKKRILHTYDANGILITIAEVPDRPIEPIFH